MPHFKGSVLCNNCHKIHLDQSHFLCNLHLIPQKLHPHWYTSETNAYMYEHLCTWFVCLYSWHLVFPNKLLRFYGVQLCPLLSAISGEMIQESKIIELFDSELFSTNILIDIASQASLAESGEWSKPTQLHNTNTYSQIKDLLNF